MSRTPLSLDGLAAMIRDYAAAQGIQPSKVGREPFFAAHRGRVGTVDEFRAIWTLAKAEAAQARPGTFAAVPPGMVPVASQGETNPEIHPLPIGMELDRVSTLRRTEEGVQWTIAKRAKESPEALIIRLMEELPAAVAARDGAVRPPAFALPSDRIAVYPLGDPHVGMLAWGEESGADFDLSLCESLMVGAMRDLVLRGPPTHEALIVNLGDFLHYDNSAARTTRGDHTLDVDSRAPKVLAVAMRVLVALIDAALEHHQQVTVDNRIGNHDGHTSLMLSLALGAYYRNEPRVSVPPTVRHRAYYERGAVLIGTTHGDRAKPDDLAAIMAAEQPAAWGRTRHRYWLTGHIHHQTRKEHRGCVVESFRTLAAADSWHSAQGYISGRDMHRIVYDVRHGEVSREIVNVGALLAEVRP